MNTLWSGITAGLLAGGAGATAKNMVSYLDHAATGTPPPSSPTSSTVADTASTTSTVVAEHYDRNRSSALGPLGGLAVGVGVGAVAGALRGTHATPNPLVAAAVTGGAAMAVGDGLAAATGHARSFGLAGVARDLVAHLAFGAVTGYALHRMLDPRTPTVSRWRDQLPV